MFGKKSGIKVIVIILILLILILGGVTVVLLLNNNETESKSDKSKNDKSAKEEVSIFEEKIGDSAEPVIDTVNQFLKAYEKFDAEALDKLGLAPFMDNERLTVVKSKERYIDRIGNEDAAFLMGTDLAMTMSDLMLSDFAKSFEGLAENILDYYGNKFKLHMNYKIKDICEDSEIDYISYRDGLSVVECDPDERVEMVLNGNVDEWYAVNLKGTWKINGCEGGFDYGLLEYLYDKSADDDFLKMNIESRMENFDRMVENNKPVEDFWIIVYKYEDEWYVYNPLFVKTSYSRSMEVVLK